MFGYLVSSFLCHVLLYNCEYVYTTWPESICCSTTAVSVRKRVYWPTRFVTTAFLNGRSYHQVAHFTYRLFNLSVYNYMKLLMGHLLYHCVVSLYGFTIWLAPKNVHNTTYHAVKCYHNLHGSFSGRGEYL